MEVYRDEVGRDWELRLDVTMAQKIKAHCGVNLYKLIEDDFTPLAELVSDPLALFEVLAVACADQCQARGLDPVGFAEGYRDGAIDRAALAFWNEYANFYPSPPIRAALKRLGAAVADRRAELMPRATATIEGLDIKGLVNRSLGWSGDAPESSGSTPDPSPPAS